MESLTGQEGLFTVQEGLNELGECLELIFFTLKGDLLAFLPIYYFCEISTATLCLLSALCGN